MSVSHKGQQLHPDDWDASGVPDTDGLSYEDWQAIGLAIMHERDLTPDERMRLVYLLTEALAASGVPL